MSACTCVHTCIYVQAVDETIWQNTELLCNPPILQWMVDNFITDEEETNVVLQNDAKNTMNGACEQGGIFNQNVRKKFVL